jgi:hypothetical protein
MITTQLIIRFKNNKHSFISDFKGGGCLHFMKCVCVCMCVYVRIDLSVQQVIQEVQTQMLYMMPQVCVTKKSSNKHVPNFEGLQSYWPL